MKTLIALFVVAAAFLTPLAHTEAYGGGFGFPPSYFGSPVVKECRYEPLQIFNKTIWLKRCEVTRDIEFRDRVREFVERVRYGGYDD